MFSDITTTHLEKLECNMRWMLTPQPWVTTVLLSLAMNLTPLGINLTV